MREERGRHRTSVSLDRWRESNSQLSNKLHWKNPSQISYIEDGLRYLAENYDELGISSIAMPALGCGLGGLNWDDILPLVEKYLGPIATLDVFIYKPKSADAGTGKAGGKKAKGRRASDDIAAQPSLF